MESAQLGLQDYNDAILSVYGANPVVQMAAPSSEETDTEETVEETPTKKEKRIKKGTLFTETLKLKKAALLNLSLAKRIFDYEESRLKQLVVAIDELKPSRTRAEDSSDKEKEDKEEEGGIGGLFTRFFRNLFSKLGKALSLKFRRSIGRKNRLRIKKLQRQYRKSKLLTKRFGRNLTKPFRQTGRFFKSLPKKAWKGIKGLASTANQVRKFIGGSIQMAKGPKAPMPPKPSGFKMPQMPKGISNFMKGAKNIGRTGPLSALFAGFELSGRKGAGQTDVQAGVGTAASVAGGLAGAKGGAMAGAALGGTIGLAFGGIGAAPGAAIGAIIGGIGGGFAGSFGASKLADAATGVKEKQQYAEGGVVTGPQLALIGEGGEPEYVVPQSKLGYFLSGKTGVGLANAGAKAIFSGVRKFADSIGLDSKVLSSIPELSLEKSLPPTDISVPVTTDVRQTPKFNLGKNIFDKIIEGFKNLLKDLPSLLPGPLKALLNGALSIGNGLTNLTNGLGLTDGDEKSASPYLTSGGVGPDAYVYSKFRSANRPGHNGVDYSGGPFSKVGTPISVIMPGVVEDTGSDPNGWGNFVVIKHTNGKFSLYGHLNSINVGKGQKLEPDASGNAPVIGTLGSTGRSQGPHLHFEMGSGWTGGVLENHINPEPHAKSYFRAGGTKVTKKPDPKGTDAPKVSGSGNLEGNLTAPLNPFTLSPALNMTGGSILPTPEDPWATGGTNTILNTGGGVRYIPVPVPTKSNSNKPSSIYSTWGTTPNK